MKASQEQKAKIIEVQSNSSKKVPLTLATVFDSGRDNYLRMSKARKVTGTTSQTDFFCDFRACETNLQKAHFGMTFTVHKNLSSGKKTFGGRRCSADSKVNRVYSGMRRFYCGRKVNVPFNPNWLSLRKNFRRAKSTFDFPGCQIGKSNFRRHKSGKIISLESREAKKIDLQALKHFLD